MYIMPGSTILPFAGHLPQLAEGTFLATGAVVIGRAEIGAGSNIWFNAVLRADDEAIQVGAGTNIQDGTVVHVTAGRYATRIGDYVTVGHGAIIHACTVGDLSLIGMGSVILDGAVIPKYSLVAAGSVVPPGATYPERSMIRGAPAKAVRTLTEAEIAGFMTSAEHYIALARSYFPPAGH